MSVTSTRFLRGLKRRIIMPANQALLSDADLLEITDDVIRSDIVPLMISTRENFYVYLLTDLTVANQELYNLPKRATASTLRDFKYKKAGNANDIRDMILVDLEDDHLFTNAGGDPHSFYFREDQVVLVGAVPVSNDILQFYTQVSPGRLVQETAAAKVASVAGDVITAANVPATFTAGKVVNFIRRAGTGRYLGFDKTITSVSGTSITFGSGVVGTEIGADDYIALSDADGDQSPVLQMSEEVAPLLESLTAQRALNEIGHFEAADKLDKRIKREEEMILKVLEPRIRGETQKIVNRRGLLRGRRSWFRRSVFN